jgi:hypothetical protein
MAGEVAKHGVYTVSNIIDGHGWDSFGKAFDDMGGITLNLLNASLVAGLLGVDAKIADRMNVGLFELNINRDGDLSSRIGMGGVDVSDFCWRAPMTGVGLLAGGTMTLISKLMGNDVLVELDNNAVSFNTGLNWNGAITFGNTIIYAVGDIERYNKNWDVPRYDGTADVPLGRHEEKHTFQYERFGIFMIPELAGSAILNGGIGAAFNAPSGRGNAFDAFMERSALERAADDYAQSFINLTPPP